GTSSSSRQYGRCRNDCWTSITSRAVVIYSSSGVGPRGRLTVLMLSLVSPGDKARTGRDGDIPGHRSRP
ncbi:MAG TPA: hypothetical protein VF341_01275, partial [Anaeromyxobacteraceae bacterium]